MTRSVGIDPGLLDDRTPPVDFSLEMFAQRFGRSTLLFHWFGAQFGEPLLYVIVLQRLLQSSSEFVDHWLRRALRRIESMPDRNLEAF